MARPPMGQTLLRQLQHDRDFWEFLDRDLPLFVGESDFQGLVRRTGKTLEELATFFGWQSRDDVRQFFLPEPPTAENGLKAARNIDRLHFLIMLADEAATAW